MSPVWVLGGVQPFQPMLGAITISRAGDCALALLVMGSNRVCFTLPQMAPLPRPLSRNIWQLLCARAQHIREKPGLNYRGRHRLWLFVFLMCRFQGDLNAVWPGPGGGYLSIIWQETLLDDCARGRTQVQPLRCVLTGCRVLSYARVGGGGGSKARWPGGATDLRGGHPPGHSRTKWP